MNLNVPIVSVYVDGTELGDILWGGLAANRMEGKFKSFSEFLMECHIFYYERTLKI
jgi:hypothetical protein